MMIRLLARLGYDAFRDPYYYILLTLMWIVGVALVILAIGQLAGWIPT